MNLREKAELTIKKLISQTRKGELLWERRTDVRAITEGTQDMVSAFYETTGASPRFRVFEARSQALDPESERLYWTAEPRIQMIDNEGVVIWNVAANDRVEAWDLLETVQIKAGNVEDALDQFLRS